MVMWQTRHCFVVQSQVCLDKACQYRILYHQKHRTQRIQASDYLQQAWYKPKWSITQARMNILSKYQIFLTSKGKEHCTTETSDAI
jgi:hypothetical protein